MNYDDKLVQFIMSMTEEQFDAWAEVTSQEEINEAIKAIQVERSRLAELEEYLEEEELENLSDARNILAAFTLNGLN